jgi:hypothetical protein
MQRSAHEEKSDGATDNKLQCQTLHMGPISYQRINLAMNWTAAPMTYQRLNTVHCTDLALFLNGVNIAGSVEGTDLNSA